MKIGSLYLSRVSMMIADCERWKRSTLEYHLFRSVREYLLEKILAPNHLQTSRIPRLVGRKVSINNQCFIGANFV